MPYIRAFLEIILFSILNICHFFGYLADVISALWETLVQNFFHHS